ncbi:uncharacterized protein LOC129610862 [Condylostylus longicornis]|uniref:uncharacterized protein LOC129610862 n=1 Tax=Condylostylus longicornis TaxID=2530218 RepID=UPI00244E2223|nr:uncharacterized protein LOC129610862 [Condylostylus longicornis]
MASHIANNSLKVCLTLFPENPITIGLFALFIFVTINAQTGSILSTQINYNETTTEAIETSTNSVNKNYNNNNESELNLDKINESTIRVTQSSTLQKLQLLGRNSIVPNIISSKSSHWEQEEINDQNHHETNSSEPEENWINITLAGPYPVPTKKIYNISIDSGSDIEIYIRKLDIHPTKDFLKLTLKPEQNDISNGNNVAIISVQPLILTGSLKEQLKLKAIECTNVQIEFTALERDTDDTKKNYEGFFISYRPSGEKLLPATSPPDVTVPFDELETLSTLLVVKRSEQYNETWIKMKELLCNATNQYLQISSNNYLEPCYPHNVTFTTVVHCPQNWPKSSDCIELYFAVQLYPDFNSITTIDPFKSVLFVREPGGLNKTLLSEMWDKTGRMIFKQAGYPEYDKASPNEQLMMWLSIGVGIMLIVFIVAIALLKSDIIKNKWVALEEEEKKEYKNQNDIDITMYPSPDQVVPELFPGHPNVYGNEIGYNIDNGRIPSISETRISRDIESTQMIEEGINPSFIEDEEERVGSVFRMRINGVSRDEANT